MPNIDLSILNQRQTPAFYADVFANRPAAGFVGRIFVSTDTFAFYRDNGTGWDLIGGPGTGTVTGSGAAGQVAFWSGSSLISGENNLWWDSTNNHFGINTNTPGTAADIHHDQSTILQLNQTTATNDTRIAFQNAGSSKWRVGNFYSAGSNDYKVNDAVLNINRFTIKSSSGQTFVGDETTSSGLFVVNNSSGDAHIVALGATAPSIRVRNAGVGATLQFGLGLATTTNNFIQGATGGEFCIFNDSLTAQPILFGIKDAGLGNTQEAARISASRNFLVGTSVDAGYKIDISGGAGRIASSSYTAGALLYLRDAAATGSNTTFAGLFLGSSPGTDFVLGKQSTNAVGSFAIKTGGGTSLFTLTDAGAATFSSSVTSGGNITCATGAFDAGGFFMPYSSASTSSRNWKITNDQITFGDFSIKQSSTQTGLPDTYRLYINPTGNIGIGTTSPNSTLHIAGTFRTVLQSGAGGQTLLSAISGVTNGYEILVDTSNNITHTWNTGANVACLRISPSGNLLIGKTTDTGARLQVNGKTEVTTTGSTTLQTLVGTKTANASGSATSIAYVGYTNSIRVYLYIVQDFANGATAIADITTYYGSTSGGITTNALLGNITGVSIVYNNSGYKLDVTVNYTGAAPTIYWTIEGLNNDGNIYAL